MPKQACPNCGKEHDVSIFVSGTRTRCSKCGLRFEVVREDVSSVSAAPAATSAGSAAPKIDPELATGETAISKGLSLPGYEILRTLGRGGMGEVYVARQLSLGREVAVKVLARHLAEDADFVRRFEKEAAALASLSHPNIVSIIDRGHEGDVWYFAMELVDGRSLRDLIEQGPVPPDLAVKIIVQVCRAIDYAHGRGIIHRDLKPENILVDTQGHVKVADFGLAGMIGGDDRLHLTRTDMAMGTFHYMAPEQRKSARDVDGRADLYSLGVMLYELLTGEVPVGRFRLPSEKSGVDHRLDEIILRALESDRDARYQRASAVGDDLESLLTASVLTKLPELGATAPDRPDAKGGAPTERLSGSGIERASSVVERARVGLKWILATGAFALVLVGLILWGVLGDSGRQAVRDAFASGLQDNLESGGRPRARRPATVEDGVVRLPVKYREDGRAGVVREIDFEDALAGEADWYTYRGVWAARDGAFVHDPFVGDRVTDPARIPRAFLGGERFFAEGFRLEATVRMTTKPPEDAAHPRRLARRLADLRGDDAPTAKLYLYRNKRHFFALTATLGESGGFSASWNLGDGKHYGSFLGGTGLPEPAAERPLRLALWIEADVLHASVDGHEVGSAKVGHLGEDNWGKAGLGCKYALCAFDDLRIEGRTRPPPGAAGPDAEQGEPVEP